MKLPRYPLKAGRRLTTFEFISEGPKGKIPKLIQFTPTNIEDIFNLSFGDKHPEGELDDTIISNNGDSEKVLATVVAAVYAFTHKYKDKWVYASGSTRSRTRLYRIGIAKHLASAKKDFDIYGVTGEDWELFRKNQDYEAFLVIKK
jgi:hypothetical protein